MKKNVFILIMIIVSAILIVIGLISYLTMPRKDIAGNYFTNFYGPAKEKMCCEDCLNYGEYEDSKDCYEIIEENGATKHCLLIFSKYSHHTFSQCKQLIN